MSASRPGTSRESISSASSELVLSPEEQPVAGPSRSPSIISSRPLVERESSKDQDWESEMVGQGYHPAHQMMQMQMQPQSHLQAHPQQYVQYQHAGHVRVYPQHMLGHTPQSQVMYMQSSAPNLGRPPSVHSQRSQRSHLESEDEGEFLPMEDALPQQQLYMQSTPYHTQQMHMHGNGMVSPYAMSTPLPGSSTSPLTLMSNAMHGQSPTDGMMHYHSTPVPTHMAPPRRPGMPRHSTTTGAPRPTMQRQYSLQPPPSRMPNILAHDVFAPAPGSTPVRRAISMAGVQGEMQYIASQGISPARALGPAPVTQYQFSSLDDELTTPQPNKEYSYMPSSATSASASDSSTISSGTPRHVEVESDDEEEDDSPTKAATAAAVRTVDDMDPLPARRVIIPPAKLMKPPPVCRTSAKLARTAEDPGVEGVPPGPRPTDRPTPSFACIIGQAILRSSAGGLSLEHIYRYVETAWPFFKSGDGAWRNSVRHNLSIHKMFGTIPRTEKFPPGKGGIWVIYEEEKCHWPSEDKFIKNFPPSHPHHHVCRQTMHERQKESEAIAKAKSEGREYVPKKGKKGRKLPNEEGGSDMVRTSSSMSDAPSSGGMMMMPPPMAGPSHMMMAPPTIPMHPTHYNSLPHAHPLQPPTMPMHSVTPKMHPRIMHPPPIQTQLHGMEGMDEDAFTDMSQGMMAPPRFGEKRARQVGDEDEENVFTGPKRVRVAEPSPLAPLSLQQQPLASLPLGIDDAYITPERERVATKAMMSSAFKTPALVNTSSSPTSSPMPPTLPRTANHHPSALQQAWTHEEMSSPVASPKGFSLDAAFDIKPKQPRKADDDSFWPAPPAFNSLAHTASSSPPRGPPKTPLTRSSAAVDRDRTKTPRNTHRTPFNMKTPMMFAGSPILPRPHGHEMSTPAWELEGILTRLTSGCAFGPPVMSPLRSPSRSSSALALPLGFRSPITSTDPSKYATLLGSGDGSPRGKSRSGSPSPGAGGSGKMGRIGMVPGSPTRIGAKAGGMVLPPLTPVKSKPGVEVEA